MTEEELKEQIARLEGQLAGLKALVRGKEPGKQETSIILRDSVNALKQYLELSKGISRQLKPVRDALKDIGRLHLTADEYIKNSMASTLQHLAMSTGQIEEAIKAVRKEYNRIPNTAVIVPVNIRQEMQGDQTLSELRGIRTTLEEFSKDKAKVSTIGKIEFVGGDKVQGNKIEQHGSNSKAQIKSDQSSHTENSNKPESLFKKYFWQIFSGIVVTVVAALLVGYITNFSNTNVTYLSGDMVLSLGDSQEEINGGSEKEVKIDNVRKLDPLETGKYIGELPNGIYFFARDNVIICELTEYREECLTSSNKRGRNDFEIQKVDNEYILIGFIGIESYSKIGSTNAENPLRSVVFFPKPWGEITRVVGVKFSKICRLKMRTVDIDENSTMDIFDMCASEVLTNITPHEL